MFVDLRILNRDLKIMQRGIGGTCQCQKNKLPSKIIMKRKLSPKERKFKNEFLKNPIGSRAAIKAGYSKRSAKQIACELLTRPDLKAAIEEGIAKAEEKAIVTKEYVLRNLKEVQQRCMQQKPVMKFDYAAKELAQVKEVDPETGKKIGVWEFDSMGANKSLELLGKSMRMYSEGREHTGPGGGPLQVQANLKMESTLSDSTIDKLLSMTDEALEKLMAAATNVSEPNNPRA